MFLPLEAFLRLAFSTPNRREAATRQDIDKLIQSKFHRRQRFAGGDFRYPRRTDAFLPEQLDESRFASPFFPPLQLDGTQIRDKITGMNRNPLRFHPPIVGEFFAPHRNDGFLFHGFRLSYFGHKTSFYLFSRFSSSDIESGIRPKKCCLGGFELFLFVV